MGKAAGSPFDHPHHDPYAMLYFLQSDFEQPHLFVGCDDGGHEFFHLYIIQSSFRNDSCVCP